MRLVWDKKGERYFEVGVDRAVLFLVENGSYAVGEAWNGITAINESPSGGEPTKLYANNGIYLTRSNLEELGFTIEAYTYPDSWEACDGSAEISEGITIGQQPRKHFGLVYRTLIGNDEEDRKHGYKLHFIFDGLASPSEKNNETVNDSADVDPFSWEATAASVSVDGFEPCCSLTIDSRTVSSDVLKAIEDAIYGTEASDPRMLTPDDILDIISEVTGATGATGATGETGTP